MKKRLEPVIAIFLSMITATVHAEDDWPFPRAEIIEFENLAVEIELAWNAKDSAAYTDLFSPLHSYISFEGVYYPILLPDKSYFLHKKLFAEQYADQRLSLSVKNAKPIAGDAAMVTFIGQLQKAEESALAEKPLVISTLLRRWNDEWLIDSFHASEYDSIRSLTDLTPDFFEGLENQAE